MGDSVMTSEEIAKTKAQLMSAAATINMCVRLLRPHMELFTRYESEKRDLESFGAVLAPALYFSQERTDVDAVVGPLFTRARELVVTFDVHAERAHEVVAKYIGEGVDG